MNSRSKPAPSPQDQPVNPVAGICALILPGLGHIVSGRQKRGLLAMVGVLGLFGLGLLVGGIDAVDSKGPTDKYWFIGQAAVGPIAFGVDYIHQNHFKAYDMTTKVKRTGYPRENRVHDGARWIWEPMPDSQEGPGDANTPGLGRLNEIAMLSCTLAGMLNMIVFLDALVPTGYGRRKEPIESQPAEPAAQKGAA